MSKVSAARSTNLFFEDHNVLSELYGEGDAHLKKLEKLLNIEAVARGNMLSLSGAERDIVLAEQLLMDFYQRIKSGGAFTTQMFEAALRMAPPVNDADIDASAHKGKKRYAKRAIHSDVYIKTMRKTVEPYSHMQANYIRSLYDNDLVFATGPAGTGKTFIAVAMGVYMIMTNKVERIILSRPAVEAGEKLGFLPGNLKEKIDPYLRPLYDALFDMMPADKVNFMMESGAIEVAPLAFMRGRTLSNSFIILDEAQNTTSTQMKMFLTRLGENSRMVITGDMSQVDLPKDVKSGLHDCLRKITHIDGISVVAFSDTDVVRHELVSKIVHAYDDWDKGVRPEDLRLEHQAAPDEETDSTPDDTP